jgi:multiple sugar transport system ATP-binding protein
MNFQPALVKDKRLYFPLLDLEVPVPGQALISQGYEHVIAGIRPEHFRALSKGGTQGNNQTVFETIVDVVEWLGADLLAYSQKTIPEGSRYWSEMPALSRDLGIEKSQGDKLDLVARLDTAHSVKEGDSVKLGFDPNKLHLFDPQSGDCITST